MSLDAPSQRGLLHLARWSIASGLGVPDVPRPADLPVFGVRRGAFVTLRIDSQLRGCIGRIEPDQPLGHLVPEVARSAAFSDPRFAPLSLPEYERVRIEISVLTPPQPVSPDAVEVGRDGVIVSARGRRGLLLPQVPGEYGWSREEFLDHACAKASLPPNAWRDGRARVFAFTADVFEEEGEG